MFHPNLKTKNDFYFFKVVLDTIEVVFRHHRSSFKHHRSSFIAHNTLTIKQLQGLKVLKYIKIRKKNKTVLKTKMISIHLKTKSFSFVPLKNRELSTDCFFSHTVHQHHKSSF